MISGRSFRVVTIPLILGLASTGVSSESVPGGLLLMFATVFAALSMRALMEPQREVTPSYTVAIMTGFLTSLATTLSVTIIITYRILSVGYATSTVGLRAAKARRCGLACFAGDYGRIVEVIVESAALYSVSCIAFLVVLKVRPMYSDEALGIMTVITVCHRSSTLTATHSFIQGLAPCLIIARVSLRIARPEATWHSKTQMQFGSVGTGRRTPTGDVELDTTGTGLTSSE